MQVCIGNEEKKSGKDKRGRGGSMTSHNRPPSPSFVIGLNLNWPLEARCGRRRVGEGCCMVRRPAAGVVYASGSSSSEHATSPTSSVSPPGSSSAAPSSSRATAFVSVRAGLGVPVFVMVPLRPMSAVISSAVPRIVGRPARTGGSLAGCGRVSLKQCPVRR